MGVGGGASHEFDMLSDERLHAVATVPAHFNDSQRQATRGAGQICGLNGLNARLNGWSNAHVDVCSSVCVNVWRAANLVSSVCLWLNEGLFKCMDSGGSMGVRRDLPATSGRVAPSACLWFSLGQFVLFMLGSHAHGIPWAARGVSGGLHGRAKGLSSHTWSERHLRMLMVPSRRGMKTCSFVNLFRVTLDLI